MKDVSTRNSPVKTGVSRTESFVRLVPFSQVKSANANGSAAFFGAGAAFSWATIGRAPGISRLAARRRAARLPAPGADGDSWSIGLEDIRPTRIILSKDFCHPSALTSERQERGGARSSAGRPGAGQADARRKGTSLRGVFRRSLLETLPLCPGASRARRRRRRGGRPGGPLQGDPGAEVVAGGGDAVH